MFEMFEFLFFTRGEGKVLVEVQPETEAFHTVIEHTKAGVRLLRCSSEETIKALEEGRGHRCLLSPYGTIKVLHTDAEEAAAREREKAHAARKASPQYAAELAEARALRATPAHLNKHVQHRVDRQRLIADLPAGAPLRVEAERLEAAVAASGARKG